MKPIENKSLSTVLVLLSAVFFAIGGMFFKLIDGWNALAINWARSVLAGLLILTVLLIKKHKFVINKSVLLAAVCISVTNNCFALSNKLTSAGNTIVLQFTMPVFVILIMAIFYKKKPTKLEIGVCIAVIAGVILMSLGSLSMEGGSRAMIGNALSLFSGLTYAGFFIFNSREDSEPFTAILLAYSLSALIDLPFFIQADFAATAANPKTIAGILCLGFIQQGLAQLCLSAGIKNISPVTSALVSGVEPVLNPILAAIFINEHLGVLGIIGAALVLDSILIYNVISAKKG